MRIYLFCLAQKRIYFQYSRSFENRIIKSILAGCQQTILAINCLRITKMQCKARLRTMTMRIEIEFPEIGILSSTELSIDQNAFDLIDNLVVMKSCIFSVQKNSSQLVNCMVHHFSHDNSRKKNISKKEVEKNGNILFFTHINTFFCILYHVCRCMYSYPLMSKNILRENRTNVS